MPPPTAIPQQEFGVSSLSLGKQGQNWSAEDKAGPEALRGVEAWGLAWRQIREGFSVLGRVGVGRKSCAAGTKASR